MRYESRSTTNHGGHAGIKVTVLVDTTVATGIPEGRSEWGFAAAIDDVLFGTDQSETAIHSARLLDIPTEFEDIVLSHAHYDHTTGLNAFLDPFDKLTMYCHPDMWNDRYLRETADGRTFDDPVHIGVPFARSEVETGADIAKHTDPVELPEGLFALGEIVRPHADSPVHLREVDGKLVADSYRLL